MFTTNLRHHRLISPTGTLVLPVLIAMGLGACSVQLPNPFPFGTAFITKGTFEMRSSFGSPPCPIWVDTSGAIFQLFQGADVANADFDRVTTPGVTSRLRIVVRDDLIVGCKLGTTVEVQEVLEFIE